MIQGALVRRRGSIGLPVPGQGPAAPLVPPPRPPPRPPMMREKVGSQGLFDWLARQIRQRLPAMPVTLIFSLIVLTTSIFTAIAAWSPTFGFAVNYSLSLANSTQYAMLEQVSTRVARQVSVVERTVAVETANWASGAYSFATPAAKAATLSQMLSSLIMFRDMITTQTFTTAQGAFNGVSVSQKSTGSYDYVQLYTDDSLHFTLRPIDFSTTPPSLLAVQTDLPYWNATGELWVQLVQPPALGSPARWSRSYGFVGMYLVSLAKAAFDPSGNYQGVVSMDFDIGIFGKVLNDSLSELTTSQGLGSTMADTRLYLFEASTDRLLGSTTKAAVDVFPEANGEIHSNSLNDITFDPCLMDIAKYLKSKNKRLGSQPAWAFFTPGYSIVTKKITSTLVPSTLQWVVVLAIPTAPALNMLLTGSINSWTASGLAIAFMLVFTLLLGYQTQGAMRRLIAAMDALARGNTTRAEAKLSHWAEAHVYVTQAYEIAAPERPPLFKRIAGALSVFRLKELLQMQVELRLILERIKRQPEIMIGNGNRSRAVSTDVISQRKPSADSVGSPSSPRKVVGFSVLAAAAPVSTAQFNVDSDTDDEDQEPVADPGFLSPRVSLG
ncbi:hypothetical protein BC828DRAFT_373778 [Blastocladiella britannica]|nr:hypothetical protein BC828DRAFT_373778 [Blastocladiella britannica]